MKKVLIIVSICLIIVVGGVLTGLYVIGGKIIDETIDAAFNDILSEYPVAAESSVDVGQQTQKEEAAIDPPSVQAVESTGTTEQTKPGNKTAGRQPERKAEAKSTGQQPEIMPDKIQEVKEKVTAQDKIYAATVVMSKLSAKDIDKLTGMLAGGLTAEEKAEAKKIAFATFSASEIEKIKEIYARYMN